ncbi:5-dehydro-4-deoxyglucarate dehydratase [Rathayibacter sp. SD072]|uniref:5-dehydro-4-deoxyglucarate dehydratase n=1 Tax=Rathayibacter sp. SD072 TaxID=2781731 RepID=UPI001A9726DE|nr:5-dehydro-4-deoxyglucarate dehydratase [Rathayibacter sp. SD072]MBO0985407.1 5-dehydro-4-deoxyglucarate dehydratase [Rathayibacter sp. SD072]
MTDATTEAPGGVRALDGVLFFPVTPFDEHDRVDVEALAAHVGGGVSAGAGGVFIACGTGEFHALGIDEYAETVRVGVEATGGRVPVIAGVGGPLGHARACIRAAEESGVDGLLILPPYLVRGPQEGVARYVEQLAASTSLPLIAYHRGTAAFSLRTAERLLALPTLVGIKDGVGDIALAQQFVNLAARVGREDVQFFNGLLTAEASQAAYRAIGVPLYSSAVFAMAPDIALAFYAAYRDGDVVAQRRLLDGFYTPLIQLRDTTPGFAVSLIKAGVRLGGIDVGSVRAPLVDPSPAQLSVLSGLLETAREMVA